MHPKRALAGPFYFKNNEHARVHVQAFSLNFNEILQFSVVGSIMIGRWLRM